MASTKRQQRPMTHAEMEEEVQAAEAKKALESKGLRKTNFGKIEQYMNWGNPMQQILVMLAVEKFVDDILANEKKVWEQLKNSPIYPAAIIEAAKEWRKQNPK
jgi:hypothetical protein